MKLTVLVYSRSDLRRCTFAVLYYERLASNVRSVNTAGTVNHTFSHYAQYNLVPVNLHSSRELNITS